jgi:hypothetical protein
MKTYYLRCIESDKPLLFNLAQKLGLLLDVDGVLTTEVYTPQGCTWDEVGYINVPTGKTLVVDGVETPETSPNADKNGNKYWHINLILDDDVVAGKLSKFFIMDADNNPVAPNAPARVFL